MSYCIILEDETKFVNQVEESEMGCRAVVDFWAPWCGPCRTMEPMLEAAAQEMAADEATYGGARCFKVNVDDNRDLAARFEIRSIPTLVFFKEGRKVAQVSGVMDKNSILEKVRNL